MTFSIVARDSSTGAYGVCGMTSIVGYGFLVPQASLRGAVATQAYVNTNMSHSVMQLADAGMDAAEAARAVVAHDSGKERRQLLAIGERGQAWAWSGPDGLGWTGHMVAEGHAAAGNTLTGPAVVEAISQSYLGNSELEFGLRLIRAVQAGQAAGGERQDFTAAGVAKSAALLIASPIPRFWHNLRLDATQGDPSEELEALYELAVHEGGLMDELYEGTGVVIRPTHWRTVRDLTSELDPPDYPRTPGA